MAAQLLCFIGWLLSSPIQVVLYPIAGIVGILAGGVVYFIFTLQNNHDFAVTMAWISCFIALYSAEPTEFKFANRHPSYPKVRHWIRLALIAGTSFYFLSQVQDVPPSPDDIEASGFVAAVFTLIMHFLLRSLEARRVWDGILQTALGLRKA